VRGTLTTLSSGIKITIFAIVTVLATGVLAISITNSSFEPTFQYSAVFSDVTGLLKGDEVRVAGVRIGQVDDIKLYKGQYAKVTFSVARTRPLFANTLAIIRYRNLAGQRYMSLEQGPGTPSPISAHALIPMSHTRPALDLTVLFNGFRPLFRALQPQQVNQLSYEIIRVLQGEGGTVNGLLAHVASLTNTLADHDQIIGRVITNLNSVLRTVDNHDRDLSQLLVQLQSFVSGLSGDRNAIGTSLTGINALTSQTASLITDARPSVREDVKQLGKVSKSLDKNKGLLNQTAQDLPGRLNALANAGSYGSWFNFYLCSLDAKIAVPGVAHTQTVAVNNENARCK
jgi:phospholipid/cholesterol/gamma-HCH transport system substrate-binding protein